MKNNYRKTITLLTLTLLASNIMLPSVVSATSDTVPQSIMNQNNIDSHVKVDEDKLSVGAYLYTVDDLRPRIDTPWRLHKAKYPNGVEPGTITYGDLIDGVQASEVISDMGDLTCTFSDLILFLSQYTNGQIDEDEYEKLAGAPLTDGDIEILAEYEGYSLDLVQYQSNLDQLITDDLGSPMLGIPFIKNDSRTVIHYVDEEGNTLFDDYEVTGVKGHTPDVSVSSPIKDGYTPDQSEVLVHLDGEQEITVVYKANPIQGGNITVHYQDEEGNTLSDDVVLSGNIGDSFTSECKNIEGYTFKEVNGEASGIFTDTEQTVNYIYRKNTEATSNVIVKYVDTEGKDIADSIILTGTIGESYVSEQKKINGYSFKEIQGESRGKFTNTDITVKYIYVENEAGALPSDPIEDNHQNKEENQMPDIENEEFYRGDSNIDKEDISKKLPSTGESTEILIGIVGVLILLCTSITLFFIKKNKKI